jgi:hypothetical protein
MSAPSFSARRRAIRARSAPAVGSRQAHPSPDRARCSSSPLHDGPAARAAAGFPGCCIRLRLGLFEVWRLDFEIGKAGGAERVGQPVGIPNHHEGELIRMDE